MCVGFALRVSSAVDVRIGTAVFGVSGVLSRPAVVTCSRSTRGER